MEEKSTETNDTRDCYQILGVERYSDRKTCKVAYNKLVLTAHPDKLGHEPTVQEQADWALIQKAYKILGDEDKKALYDQQLRSGLRQNVIASLFIDFTDLINKEDKEFFSVAKDLMKGQEAMLEHYWLKKDLRGFSECYSKFRQFLDFFNREVSLREDRTFDTTETEMTAISYYPEVKFLIGENPTDPKHKGANKNFFINLSTNGQDLVITLESGEQKTLDINQFSKLVNNDFIFKRIQGQIDGIKERLKTSRGLSDEEDPNWKKDQSKWVEYILSLYKGVDEDRLVGQRVSEQIEGKRIIAGTELETANKAKVKAYAEPIEKQLEKMAKKYSKKLAYASTAHRIWASEKIFQDYNERIDFTFTEPSFKDNYKRIAEASLTPEQAKKFGGLSDGSIFEVKGNELMIVLLINTLVQKIDDLFNSLINKLGATTAKPAEEPESFLLLEGEAEKTNKEGENEEKVAQVKIETNEEIKVLHNVARHSTFFNPPPEPPPSLENNNTASMTNEEKKLIKEIKQPLYNYIARRGFEAKYAGSRFGFNIKDKIQAADLLYHVLYFNEDKQQLLDQPKLLKALKQGQLGDIAKEVVESLEKNNQPTLGNRM